VIVTHSHDVAQHTSRILHMQDGLLVGDSRLERRHEAQCSRTAARVSAHCARTWFRAVLTSLGVVIGVGSLVAVSGGERRGQAGVAQSIAFSGEPRQRRR